MSLPARTFVEDGASIAQTFCPVIEEGQPLVKLGILCTVSIAIESPLKYGPVENVRLHIYVRVTKLVDVLKVLDINNSQNQAHGLMEQCSLSLKIKAHVSLVINLNWLVMSTEIQLNATKMDIIALKTNTINCSAKNVIQIQQPVISQEFQQSATNTIS